ncbi:MAG: SdrD B-like domain-containing protein [Pseudomonadota bacterium]|nr:SdrD B-like domain-containing protein [Pseudomonadota bacterium]MDP1905177.1 SdrD B-like domain-containing protein [Pseudomonadota bacterium]MDP2353407.1 SdrD B-like domain-containing protein [Pseudomonadota bacterium]
MSQPPVVTIKVNYPGSIPDPSLFDIQFLSSSVFGFNHYDAWCADRDIGIDLYPQSDGTYSSGSVQASVYSTYELSILGAAIPTIENPGNLDVVNWLLNQHFSVNGYTLGEVQAAIWTLLGDDYTTSTIIYPRDPVKVAQLVALANQHDGFVPDITDNDPSNDDIAVMLFPHLSNGTAQQPTIIQVKSAALGDYVWADSNADGVQDGNEYGVQGVIVNLWRDLDDDATVDANEILGTTTTDATGYYKFFGLTPGLQYQLQFIKPDNYSGFTLQDQAADTTDSDANANGITAAVTLAPGEFNTSIDAGLVQFQPAKLSGYVYEDSNNDGSRAGETPIPGTTVTLSGTDDLGNPVTASTTTDANGYYEFVGLRPGTYSVAETQPAGYLDGKDTAGSTGGVVTNDLLSSIPLAAGQHSEENNFGELKPASIAGFVYGDADNDGIKDAGETAIPGATVTLTGTDDLGNPVSASTTTAADGSYSFDNLRPGSYTVTETQPAGWLDGKDTAGSTGGTVSNDQIAAITLNAGDASVNNNFGELLGAKLSGYVYEDSNNDGSRAGETLIANVSITLTGTDDLGNPVTASTTTNAAGYYEFIGLRPGSYSVAETQPAGYLDGKDTIGTTGGGVANDLFSAIPLAAGQHSAENNFGELKPASIAGFVYGDADNDGIKDAGETPIPGATVTLTGTDDLGAPVSLTTTTAADGSYNFGNLRPGNYTVTETQPAGWLDGKDTAGAPGGGTAGNDVISAITLNAGDASVNNNFGELLAASLGDRLWVDSNGDGIQNDGATGISGQTLTLIGGGADGLIATTGDNTTATTTTGADGYYQFTGLNVGEEYQVQFSKPTGTVYTGQNLGGDDTLDSDVNAAGLSQIVTLTSGENNPTLDAGVYTPVSIGDRVWEDSNGDGDQDGGEPGIGGVKVTLINCATNAIVASTTTADGTGADPMGWYNFAGVPPGTYHVVFETPSGYVATTANVGGDDSTDSDAVGGVTGCYTLNSGDSNTTVDAGFLRTASLGDRLWVDSNGDGIQNDGATGISGQTITLIGGGADGLIATGGDNTTATTTTGADGYYQFTGLNVGEEYQVQFSKPIGTVYTGQNLGGDDTLDSDVNAAGLSQIVTLSSGEHNPTLDAGIYTPVSIGDKVWEDSNGNGKQDDGEPGVGGVKVTLVNCATNAIVATTTTADGTGSNPIGYYNFAGVPPGTYHVVFETPNGYVQTTANVGGNGFDTTDSDAVNGVTGCYTLNSGDTNTTVDAGFLRSASLGDRLWVDSNGDGIQNDGATGIAGQTITLIGGGADGLISTLGDNTTATTTTGADGYYQFTGLNVGEEYQVQFSKPTGTVFTGQNLGGDDTLDSDVNALGLSQIVTLSSGEHNPTLDAGIYVPNIGIDIEKYVRGEYTNSSNEGGEGLTPGYWKNHTSGKKGQPSEWVKTGFSPSDSYESIFGVDVPGNPTLLDALKAKGGGVNALMRHSTAALLNASHGYVDYQYSAAEVIAMTQAAIAGADYEPTKDLFDHQNNMGADLTTLATTTTTVVTDWFDADTPTGPYIPVGGVAQFKYEITNTGSVALSNIQVIDDRIASLIFVGGDTDNDGMLDVDETWTYLASEFVTMAGLHTNIGTVTGFDANTGSIVSDSDAANYTTSELIASIGDRVWLDANANGIQDLGEEGIEGVAVNLLDSLGALIASTVTDTDGEYLFDDLPPGDYIVEVITPTAYFVTQKDAGSNDAKDSDIDPLTGRTIVTTLSGGEYDMTWDAGLYQKASIGDKVWLDCNANGIQDANEIGLSGVTVKLLSGTGAELATTTTDFQGNYLFNNLVPGDYAIQVIAPTGYGYTARDQGGDDTRDSDVDASTGKTITTTLTSGENDLSWDAGLTTVGACVDMVFSGSSATDGSDGNIRTYSQNGLSVNVSAFSRDKSTGAWADAWLGTYGGGLGVTDSSEGSGSGNTHTVDNVGGRDNYVMFEFSQFVMLDKAYLGYVVGDSDMQLWIGNFNTPFTSHIGLNDAVLSQMGFMEVNTTTLSSARWADLNAGEYLGNVIVMAADTTDMSPEDYFKIQTLSVCTPACGLNASIGDKVWLDANANGIQDAGEAGLSGVSVKLLNSAGAVVSTTTTDANGNYLFSNLTPGDYAVQVMAPNGYLISAKDQGGNDATDSDFDPTTGKTTLTTLTGGENDLSWDAGLYQLASIGDKVWLDSNKNGIQDAGETGLSGVTVNLLNASGAVVATATTNTSGNYLFSNLAPGDYAIQVVAPNGYAFSAKDQGGNDALDSDVDGVTGRTITTTLTSGENDLSWDAGLYLNKARIGDTVWEDLNYNGIQDAGEAGIANVTVKLQNSSGTTLQTKTTDANGNYFFDVDAGTYRVQMVKPTGYFITKQDQGGNDGVDSDINSSGISGLYTVSAGQENLTVDGGLYKKASIGDKVWLDANGNGVQDAGEAGLSGVSVKLLNSAGTTLSTTTTDANGNYLFSNLNPGDYAVQLVAPSGYVFTGKDLGGNDATDSDFDPATGKTVLTSLTSGENDLSWDAGLYQKASIGDKVWLDSNKNGIQDSGEAGMSGVSVNLLNAAGVVVATATTNASGNYLFSNLAPGDYAIQVVAPNGYAFSAKDQGGNDALDSDVDSVTGKTVLTSLTSGENDLSWDAGLYLNKARIGDTVWEDMNYNGIQDAGEAGIVNVKVYLRSTAGTILQTTYTDTNGKYGFDVDAGTYQVQVVRPSGYFATKQDQGSNDGSDSDINSSGYTGLYTVTTGQQNLTVDGGLYRKASVGDKVWDDMNHNGLQDANEPGIAGIKITLKTSSGSTVASTTTNSTGNYNFANLNPGDYYLVFDKTNVMHYNYGAWYNMNDWKWAVKDVGSNDSIDSDVTGDGKSKTNVTQTSVFNLESGENDMSWDAGITPIAIDLNGDGIQTISRANAGGSFDLLGTGKAIQSGWLSGEDGFLAFDRNGNGRIDDISELFGGYNKGDGYAKLAAFDSNGDGVVDANDAAFADLRVWKDGNGNHQTDEGELLTLAEAGVASLSLAYQALPLMDGNGNLHLERGSATMADGSEVDMTDVYFGIAAADAADAGIELPNLADLLSDSGSLDGLVGSAAPMLAPVDYAANDACGGSGLEAMKQLADLIDQQAAYA